MDSGGFPLINHDSYSFQVWRIQYTNHCGLYQSWAHFRLRNHRWAPGDGIILPHTIVQNQPPRY